MRKLVVAVVVLIGLAVAAFLLLREKPDVEREAVRQVLLPVPPDKLDRIEIRRHEPSMDPLDDEYITLERKGDAWRMTKPVDYAVNPTSVAKMVEALGALRVIDVISENREKHAVLEVDEALGIDVKAFGGQVQLASFIVGVSRGDMTMVRLPGEDRVYRVRGTIRQTFNKSVKNLRDHAVLQLDRGSVTRIRYVDGDADFEMVKQGEGEDAKFVPVGMELQNFDWRRAAGNANSLTGLSTRDFVDQPVADDVSGLGAGATRVEFDASKGGVAGTYTIWIGKDLEKERQTYVKTSAGDQVFLVSTHLVKRFRTRPEDFARTDEQVAAEEKQRKAAEEHGKMHEQQRQAAQAAKAAQGQAGGQEIPPEILEQLRAKAQQGQPPSPHPGDHQH